jgi:hypothetical protein
MQKGCSLDGFWFHDLAGVKSCLGDCYIKLQIAINKKAYPLKGYAFLYHFYLHRNYSKTSAFLRVTLRDLCAKK